MYDFCFTFPFAGLLALGGLMGFVTKGSVPSLFGGLGSAAVLAVCAQISLARYHQVICKFSRSQQQGRPALKLGHAQSAVHFSAAFLQGLLLTLQ